MDNLKNKGGDTEEQRGNERPGNSCQRQKGGVPPRQAGDTENPPRATSVRHSAGEKNHGEKEGSENTIRIPTQTKRRAKRHTRKVRGDCPEPENAGAPKRQKMQVVSGRVHRNRGELTASSATLCPAREHSGKKEWGKTTNTARRVDGDA